MTNRQTLLLSISLLLLLLLSGCPDQTAGTAWNAAPAGMGYFLLKTESAEPSRTIMPEAPEVTSLYYTLEFYKSGTTTSPQVTGPVSYSKLSDPVLLEQGTWDLTVKAFSDAAGTQMAAQAQKTGIVIDDGQITTSNVTLKPFSPGVGKGTFSWTINYPSGVSMASMIIAKTPSGTGDKYYFEGGTPQKDKTGSIELDTGYYYVTFTLTMNSKTLERKEVLHIYQNLKSSYTYTFTESNFFAKMTGIEVDSASQTIFAKGEPLDILIYAVYSDGTTSLISMDAVTSNYDKDTEGTQSLTITHTVTDFTTSFTVTVQVFDAVAKIGAEEYSTLSEAISAASAAAAPVEITIIKDIVTGSSGEPANYTITAGKTLTIKGDIATRKITRGTQDSNASNGLFIVESGVQLVFEDIVIDGNKGTLTGNKASLVRVNAGGSFTMNDKAVLQNNSAENGGGVYVVGTSSAIGTFTMNTGSTIMNNTATQNGGGVYLKEGSVVGTFTMNGGEISSNTATSNGGGVYFDFETFTMNNGNISGNTANGTGTTNGGGGVFVNSGRTFSMYGGEISGNKTASVGGGVYNNGTFTVGKTAKVSDNTKTDNTTKSNACNVGDKYITLGTGADAPASGMEIWVQTTRADGVIVNSGATSEMEDYFHADDDATKEVVLDADRLKIQEK